MTVFSTVRKIDSIKKRMRKLTGMEKGWAKWMTNVRNERSKILVTFLTDSESTRSLQPMANGLVKTFERRQRENSLLLHLDRACIKGRIKGCHFWFTTFLVLFVLEPLVQVWVRFSLCILVLCIRCYFAYCILTILASCLQTETIQAYARHAGPRRRRLCLHLIGLN